MDGLEGDRCRITRTDLLDYTQTHYTAPRVVIAGAGALDHRYVC